MARGLAHSRVMERRANDDWPRVIFFTYSNGRLHRNPVHIGRDTEMVGRRRSKSISDPPHGHKLWNNGQLSTYKCPLAGADSDARVGENAFSGARAQHLGEAEPVAGWRLNTSVAATNFRAVPTVDGAPADSRFLDPRISDGTLFLVDDVECELHRLVRQ